MSRRTPVAVVLIAAVLLAAAAAAAPVRLWIVPPSDADVALPGGATPDTIDSPSQPEEPSASGEGLWPLPQMLAVALITASTAALMAMRGWWPANWQLGGARSRRRARFGSLPEMSGDNAGVEVDAARTALSSGQPRNAIVACWMRLESDIAAAGWPRSDAETSAEYVERVVAHASVEPSAISGLAALYREARFSDHALVEADRDDALAALSQVEASLRSNVRVPT